MTVAVASQPDMKKLEGGQRGHSGDAGQAFQLKADSDSSRSRTAIR
jgi:hypothetical protein